MKKYVTLGLLAFVTILAFVGFRYHQDRQPILEPTVYGKTYDSVSGAIDDVVGDLGYVMDDRTHLVIFFKNDCKYCKGGIGGVLEAYQDLSDDDKTRVSFHDVDTTLGRSLAKSLGVTKTSQMALVSPGGELPPKLYNYATEYQTSNKKEVRRALEDLKEWREEDE